MTKERETNLIKGEIRFPRIGRGTLKEKIPAESALTRPFNRILKEGKLTGKINYVFFGERGLTPPVYIIGSVSLTEGERILFFPGVKRMVLMSSSHQSNKVSNKIVDHLTLEKDYSWHLTFVGGEHLGFGLSQELEKDLYGWFSFSISHLPVLEILPKKLEIISPSPGSDARRRMNDMLEARKEAIFHVLHCHDISPALDNDEFLHVDVFVDLSPEEKKSNILPSPPTGPPIVTSQIALNPPFAVRNHRVEIPGFKGVLHFLVSKFTGQIKENAAIKGIGQMV